MIDRNTDIAIAESTEPQAAPEVSRGGDWLGWVPWVVSLAFVGLSLVLLGFGSKLRKDNVELAQRLADAEFANSELQNQQTGLQHKLTRVETNYATRVADLQKQLVQKNQEQERHKLEIETRLNDTAKARKQADMLQARLAQNTAELDRLSEELSGVNTPDRSGLSRTIMGLLLPTPNGPPAASGSAVYDLYDQKGILEAANLPVLPPDRDYQLWLIDPNISVPVSGAVFGVNERGYVRLEYTPTTRLRTADRFAISIERKGGANAPQGRFVLANFTQEAR